MQSHTHTHTLVCLACFQERLASVFENATEFRLFEISEKDGVTEICPAGRLPLPSRDPKDRISATMACGATLLLCGAICGRTRQLIEHENIQIVSWVSGSVDDVLHAYKENNLQSLVGPGCPSKYREGCPGGQRGRNCCGGGRGSKGVGSAGQGKGPGMGQPRGTGRGQGKGQGRGNNSGSGRRNRS